MFQVAACGTEITTTLAARAWSVPTVDHSRHKWKARQNVNVRQIVDIESKKFSS